MFNKVYKATEVVNWHFTFLTFHSTLLDIFRIFYYHFFQVTKSIGEYKIDQMMFIYLST